MTEREARTTLKEEVQASGCTMACHLQSHPAEAVLNIYQGL